jgi:hypothetical protein
MKRAIIVGLLLGALAALPVVSYAGQVNGYYRSNGTYVQPYTRSAPDRTVTNNYSFQGNTNPSTGSTGTNRYTHDQTSPYFTGPSPSGNVGHSNNGFGTNPYYGR